MSVTNKGSTPIPPKSEQNSLAVQLEMERLEGRLSERIKTNENNLKNYKEIVKVETDAVKEIVSNRLTDLQWSVGIILALVGIIGYKFIKDAIDSLVSKEVKKAIDNADEKFENKIDELDKQIKSVIGELREKGEREIKKGIDIVKNKAIRKMTPLEKEIVEDAAKEIEKKPEKEYSAEENTKLCYRFLIQKKYKEAEKFCRKAIELDPQNAIAHNYVGVVYNSLGNYEEAKNFCQKAIDLDSYLSSAYDNLGYALNKLGKYDEAIESHKKANALDPNDSNPYYNLACAYSFKEDKDNALKCLEQAIDKGCDTLKHIEEDSDLDFIRDTKEYNRIIEKLKNKLKDKRE